MVLMHAQHVRPTMLEVLVLQNVVQEGTIVPPFCLVRNQQRAGSSPEMESADVAWYYLLMKVGEGVSTSFTAPSRRSSVLVDVLALHLSRNQ